MGQGIDTNEINFSTSKLSCEQLFYLVFNFRMLRKITISTLFSLLQYKYYDFFAINHFSQTSIFFPFSEKSPYSYLFRGCNCDLVGKNQF